MPPDPAHPRKTILIVDDDETICDFFEMLLLREGFDVLTSYEGYSALERLRRKEIRKVDLLVLDLMLPGPSGNEIIKEVHKPEYQNCPILIITSRVLTEEAKVKLQAEPNVRGIWAKPVMGEDFVKEVRNILGVGESGPK